MDEKLERFKQDLINNWCYVKNMTQKIEWISFIETGFDSYFNKPSEKTNPTMEQIKESVKEPKSEVKE